MWHGAEGNKRDAVPPRVRLVRGATHPTAFIALALATLSYGVVFCRYDHSFWLSLTVGALFGALGVTSLAYRRKLGLSRGPFAAARARALGSWLGLLVALLAPLQTRFGWSEVASSGIFVGHFAGHVASTMVVRRRRSAVIRLPPDIAGGEEKDT